MLDDTLPVLFQKSPCCMDVVACFLAPQTFCEPSATGTNTAGRRSSGLWVSLQLEGIISVLEERQAAFNLARVMYMSNICVGHVPPLLQGQDHQLEGHTIALALLRSCGGEMHILWRRVENRRALTCPIINQSDHSKLRGQGLTTALSGYLCTNRTLWSLSAT